MTRRALISVTDKTGVVELAQGLVRSGFALLSSAGTARALREAGVAVQDVGDYAGFPEAMGGRLKTLHPRVHGGILARRDDAGDRAAMAEHGIDPIDVVVVNLYPFRATAAQPGVSWQEVIENIDIGGPAMIRSAAKNHAAVTIIVDPADYGWVLEALERHDGVLPREQRRALAAKAFASTAAYDAAIAGWFEVGRGAAEPFAAQLVWRGEKVQDLRYGENPHQQAAFYRAADCHGPSLATARQLTGKELSYNNILDLDAALATVTDFSVPTCVIVKHDNPCGVGAAQMLCDAFAAALASDPLSAYGGIIALNRPLNLATADAMVQQGTFVEALIAPSADTRALERLRQARWGENVRVLVLDDWPPRATALRLRQVSGGLLAQTPDTTTPLDGVTARVATERQPAAAEHELLAFAWQVVEHVKSNAIVLAQRTASGALHTVGIGAGQMSRVDAVKIAVDKAAERARGAALASDAFFPFADGVEAAAAAGVAAVIQPGGSKRDAEVVAAANRAGMAMVFTGVRHFRH